MTQEQKDLLLRDLCSRLPYGVKVLYDSQIKELQYIEPVYNEVKLLDHTMNYTVGIEEIKPYLFPLSSMSEELTNVLYSKLTELELKAINDEIEHSVVTAFEIDFYHKLHIDYLGLIPMGLANDATGLNIY